MIVWISVSGTIKAVLGAFVSQKVAYVGISDFYDTPLEKYYEPELRGEPVLYNGLGVPIHPETYV